jgi:hypothetical protein
VDATNKKNKLVPIFKNNGMTADCGSI